MMVFLNFMKRLGLLAPVLFLLAGCGTTKTYTMKPARRAGQTAGLSHPSL